MAKKTPTKLRADAKDMRELAASMLVKAEQFELDAQRLDEEAEAQQAANVELVKLWFDWRRRIVRAH